jgi:hypothetical protein
VAVVLIGFFVIRPLLFGGGSGAENGNSFVGGQVIRVGSNSFFTFADSSNKEYAIYCVGNGANDEAEAIYESKSSLRLLGADGSTLYFGEDDKYYSIPASRGTQKPERIRVTVDESDKATVAVMDEYDLDPGDFNSTGYFSGSSSASFDGGMLYYASSVYGDNDDVSLIVQKIDLKKGSLTLTKNTAVTLYDDEYASSFAYYKGDLYYTKYDNSDYRLLGIYSVKADSTTAKEKLVFDDAGSRYYYSSFILTDDRLFFVEEPSSSSSKDPTSLRQVPLSGGTVTTVTDDLPNYAYNVQGGRVYYFDGDELVSCKYDGSDVKTLAKGGDDKISLYLSDNWVYYRYSGENDWYRVRSNEGTYPKKSLT